MAPSTLSDLEHSEPYALFLATRLEACTDKSDKALGAML